LESEFSAELILFYQQVQRFRRLFSRRPPDQEKISECYAEIVETFLVPAAPLELNVPAFYLRNFNVRSKHGPRRPQASAVVPFGPTTVSEDVFSEVLDEVVQLMAGGAFLRFEQDPAYQQVWADFMAEQNLAREKHEELELLKLDNE